MEGMTEAEKKKRFDELVTMYNDGLITWDDCLMRMASLYHALNKE